MGSTWCHPPRFIAGIVTAGIVSDSNVIKKIESTHAYDALGCTYYGQIIMASVSLGYSQSE